MTKRDRRKQHSPELVKVIEQLGKVQAEHRSHLKAVAGLSSHLRHLGPNRLVEILALIHPHTTPSERTIFVTNFVAAWETGVEGLTPTPVPRALKAFVESKAAANKQQELWDARKQLDHAAASPPSFGVAPADREKTMRLMATYSLIKDGILSLVSVAEPEAELTTEEINYLKTHAIRWVQSEQSLNLGFVPRADYPAQNLVSPATELPSLNLLLTVALAATSYSATTSSSLLIMVEQWNRDYKEWKTDLRRRRPKPTLVPSRTDTPTPPIIIVQAPSAQYYAALQRAIVDIRHLKHWPVDAKSDPRDERRTFTDALSGWKVSYGNPTKAEELNPSFPKIAELKAAAVHQPVSSQDRSVAVKERAFLMKLGVGELMMDLFDILFSHWVQKEKPPQFGITDRMIQQYRGQAKYSVEELQNQQRAMQQIPYFCFDHAKDKKRHEPEPLISRLAFTDVSAVGATPELSYMVTIGSLLYEESPFHPGYTPKNGAFYDNRLWRRHPVRDLLLRQFMRYLRWEWRVHVSKYSSKEAAPFRPWLYHLEGCGLNIKDLSERPTEFLNALNVALWKMIKDGYLTGQNESTDLGKAKNDWHPGLYKSSPLNLKNLGFAEFLEREVRFLPTPPVAQALQINVVNQRVGRDTVKAKREAAKRSKAR